MSFLFWFQHKTAWSFKRNPKMKNIVTKPQQTNHILLMLLWCMIMPNITDSKVFVCLLHNLPSTMNDLRKLQIV